MSLITNSYAKPDPTQFNDQYKHKYFCEVVQGDVSNDVRQENSVAVKAGAGSIAYIDANNFGVAGLGESTDLKAVIPQIVYVGCEHGNVFSEKFNSGCGLITTHPLTAGNTYMTTVFDAEGKYEVGSKLTAKEITFEGKKVFAVTPATSADDVIIGIVRAVPAMHHHGVKGILFDAYFVA